MGSFIFNLHVRASDHGQVVRQIGDLLQREGFAETDASEAERTIYVAESLRGWVSILDTDLMQAATLAAGLSGELKTESICVFVNDSDSWHYLLYRDGDQVDEFNSVDLDDPEEMGELSQDLARMLDAGKLEEFREELQQRSAELQKQIEGLVPPHIRAIQERFIRGEGSVADQEELLRWQRESFANMSEQIKSLTNSIFRRDSPPEEHDDRPEEHPEVEPSEAASTDSLHSHVDQLRSLFVPEATDELVLSILAKQPVFAEEALAEFLPAIGIAPIYAYLQASDVDFEYEREELIAESVKFAAELRFRLSQR